MVQVFVQCLPHGLLHSECEVINLGPAFLMLAIFWAVNPQGAKAKVKTQANTINRPYFPSATIAQIYLRSLLWSKRRVTSHAGRWWQEWAKVGRPSDISVHHSRSREGASAVRKPPMQPELCMTTTIR